MSQLTIPLVGPGKNIDRDRWGRPLIIPPDGGDPVAYTRCTTYVSALDDKKNLMGWNARMVALGLAQRDDLLLKVRATDPGDKKTLGAITEEAADFAGAHRRAEIGTQIHALTERLDRGETVPDAGEYQADLDAYREALDERGIIPTEIETFVVNDYLKIGGTFDRIYTVNGRKYIGDIKTGEKLDYGVNTFAMQLAVYANSLRYDWQTGRRTPLDVDRTWAILIHLPAGEGTATVYWLDIEKGWQGVGLAQGVRAWRDMKKNAFIHPCSVPLTWQVEHAETLDELYALYDMNASQWTPRLTELAAQRKTTLTGQVG